MSSHCGAVTDAMLSLQKGGSGVLNILWKPTFGNRMVAMMKSKDLFVGGQRKLMGYT